MDTVKRIALFAHYDRDGIIDDYVIYYLRGLTGVAQRILFMSDCALKPGEAAKLDGLAELVFADRHGEYDFGSWKRGFAFLSGDLTGWDEVIIANDSCYAPVYPLKVCSHGWTASPAIFGGLPRFRKTMFLVMSTVVSRSSGRRLFCIQVSCSSGAILSHAKRKRMLSMSMKRAFPNCC